jgi:hypothetical protein
MAAAPPGQCLCLPARQQEQTSGVPGASIRQGSKKREGEREQLPQVVKIRRRNRTAADRKDDGMKKHRSKGKLLCPIRLRAGRSRPQLLEHLVKRHLPTRRYNVFFAQR